MLKRVFFSTTGLSGAHKTGGIGCDVGAFRHDWHSPFHWSRRLRTKLHGQSAPTMGKILGKILMMMMMMMIMRIVMMMMKMILVGLSARGG